MNLLHRQSPANQRKMLLFGFPLLFLGIWILGANLILPLARCLLSAHWQPIPCEIIASEVKSADNDDGGEAWRAEISYSYEFGGRKFFSKSIDFSSEVYSFDKRAEIILVRQFAAGDPATCLVNPRDPQEAVLVRDWARGYIKWAIILFCPFLAVFGLVLIFLGGRPWWQARRRNRFGHLTKRIIAPRNLLNKYGSSLHLTIIPGSLWRCGERISVNWQILGLDQAYYRVDLICRQWIFDEREEEKAPLELLDKNYLVLEVKGGQRSGKLDFVVPMGLNPSMNQGATCHEWSLRVKTIPSSEIALPDRMSSEKNENANMNIDLYPIEIQSSLPQ